EVAIRMDDETRTYDLPTIRAQDLHHRLGKIINGVTAPLHPAHTLRSYSVQSIVTLTFAWAMPLVMKGTPVSPPSWMPNSRVTLLAFFSFALWRAASSTILV